MKRHKVYAVLGLFLAVALVALAAPANAEMYVEGYIGGTFASELNLSSVVREVQPGPSTTTFDHYNNWSEVNPTVLGGLKLGTWFVKEGFAGWSGYPDWMKYFGFYTDFSFQRLCTEYSTVRGTNFLGFTEEGGGVPAGGSAAINDAGSMQAEGTVATWAFMFAGRYGFFPDSEVPFGRLQPYVGVGPAIMFSSMKPKIATTAISTNSYFNGYPSVQMSPDSQGSTNIALAADAGVRYMALKNVSIDLSFKYRYAQPSYTFHGLNHNYVGSIDQLNPAEFTLNPTYNLFSFQIGAAYHF